MTTLKTPISKISIPVIMFLIIVLSAYLLPSDSYPSAFPRWFSSAVFILFLPGYFLADAFLCDGFGLIDKLMLGFAFSVTAIANLGYLLNRLPWGINTGTILVSLLLVMLGSILARTAYERRRGATQSEKVSMLPQELRIRHYVILASIIIGGVTVRLIPFMKIGTFLDLDPYNHYMKVKAILKLGRVPSFDPLSLAPQGTSATYAITPLGFEFLVVALELAAQAPLVELMGLLPVLYVALTILAMFSLCYETTESRTASLFAAFFTAFSTSWLLIYGVSMNPVAENVGLFLFPLTLLYLARYIRTGKRSVIGCSSILFATMLYVHFFTVFYFLLALTGYLVSSFLVGERRKIVFEGVICCLLVGSLLSLPILLQIIPRFALESTTFSETVLELAFVSGSYVPLLPEDLLRIIPFPLFYLAVIALFTAVAKIAARMVSRIRREKDQRCFRNLLPFSWCLSLLLAGFVHLIEPLRNVLAATPFSGALLAGHRLVPYLTLAFYIPAAIVITDFFSKSFAKMRCSTSTLRGKFVQLSLTIFSMAIILMLSFNYTSELASWPTSDTYTDFFAWVEKSTHSGDVFVGNNWEMTMWLRAVGERPTVFSHVHQDLVSPDAKERMRLHAIVFDGVFRDEAFQMLRKYGVKYFVVTAQANYVDVINKRWVWTIPGVEDYIEEMDGRGYLERVFTGNNIWVYAVDGNVAFHSYRLNVTNKKHFIGNGWSAQYYSGSVLCRNATRGFVLDEWRFSDFFIQLDPGREGYSLEVEYFDIDSSSPVVNVLTVSNNGNVKIGSLCLNGTYAFRKAKFQLAKDLFFDYYGDVDGFQQYFVIGELPIYDLPISRIFLQEEANQTARG